MAINWTKLEENAKKVAAADKKKNPSGYVGLKSASYVSGNKKTTKKSTKSTKTTKSNSGGKNKSTKTTTQKTNGKKSGIVQGKGSNADKQLTTKSNESKRNSTIKSRQLPTSTKKAMKESKYRNFVAGVGDAVLDNSVVGIGYSIAKGKKLSDSEWAKSDKVAKGTSKAAKKAQKAGEVAGTIGSYLTAYGAAGKATGKAAAKIVGSKAGQKAVTKAAATKLGTKAGKEAVEATAKSIAKDVVADATIGTAMDLGQARGEGLEGKDLAKYMAQQAALNAVLGGAAEAAAPALKAAGKVVKKATDYHWEPRIVNGKTKYVKVKGAAKNAAEETANETTEKLLRTKSDVEGTTAKTSENKNTKEVRQENAKTPAEQQNEYVESLVNKIKKNSDKKAKNSSRKVETATDGRRVQTNKRVQNAKTTVETNAKAATEALDKEADELIQEYVKVSEMTPDEFAEYIANGGKNATAKEVVEDAQKVVETGEKAAQNGTEEIVEQTAETGETVYSKADGLPTKNSQKSVNSAPRRQLRTKSAVEEVEQPKVANYVESTPTPAHAEADELVTDAKTGETFIKETPEQTAKVAENATESLETANKAETPLDRNPIKTDADGKQTVGGFEVEGNSSNLGIVNSSEELDQLFESADSLGRTAYRMLVNRQAAIDDLAKAAGDSTAADAVQAVRSASGTTEHILTRNLVSPEGDVLLDKSFRDVLGNIPKDDMPLFNEYAQNLNNISRWEQGKPLDSSVTKADSQARVNEILAQHPEFAQITKDLNEWWNTFTHSWLVDNGRMTEDAWQAMTSKYPNYVPAFMPKKGNKGGVKTGFGKTSVKSGTHEAKAGTTLERMPIEDAMMQQISQIVSGSRTNNLIVSIIDALKKDPDGLKAFGIAKNDADIPMTDFDIDEFATLWEKEKMEQVSEKVYTISGMKDGQKVMAYVSKDMADAISTINKIVESGGGQWFSKIGRAITNPIKGAITQLNPLFAIANLSRDIPTALIQSQYGVGKTAKNMAKAVKEIATNGEYWQKYMAMGGKSSGYIKANAGFQKNLAKDKSVGASMWEGLKTVLGAAGEATESVPRLAEFISSLENGNSVYKALNDAAEVTVNFSRGGSVTKVADAWTMYLNAAVQGLDKFARAIKNAPLRTATSSLAVVGAPYAMLTAYNWANPNYQDLSDRTKQNYFCIPNLMGEVDENGYAKTFIKVPLNREYGTIFASTMDVIAGYMDGEENPWNGYLDTVKTNFLPSSVTTGNILAPLTINLPQNKDFAGRNIVSSNLEDVSPQYQYDGTTSGVAMAIARAANNLHIPSNTLKSPQKVDYLLDSYGGYFGSLAQAATDQGNQGILDAIKGLTVDPVEDRFTADARYSSGVQQAFYDAKEKATTAWNDIKVTTGEKGKEYIEYKTYNAIQQELSDLSKQEKEILNNTSLSNAEKSKRAKAIREQKNEVARGAKERVAEAVAEYEKNPKFTLMTSSQQEAYEKVKDKVSKEDYVEAKQLVKDAGVDNNTAEAFILASNGMDSKTTKAMTSKSAYKKAQELKTAGATQQDVINAAKTIKESGYTRDVGKAYALLESGQSSKITSILVSESAVNRAYALKRAGLTPDQLDTVAEKIDTNNNNRYSNDELNAYLPRANMKQSERYAVFEALKSNPNTYNPYG